MNQIVYAALLIILNSFALNPFTQNGTIHQIQEVLPGYMERLQSAKGSLTIVYNDCKKFSAPYCVDFIPLYEAATTAILFLPAI
jgi:hypothetical protein